MQHVVADAGLTQLLTFDRPIFGGRHTAPSNDSSGAAPGHSISAGWVNLTSTRTPVIISRRQSRHNLRTFAIFPKIFIPPRGVLKSKGSSYYWPEGSSNEQITEQRQTATCLRRCQIDPCCRFFCYPTRCRIFVVRSGMATHQGGSF